MRKLYLLSIFWGCLLISYSQSYCPNLDFSMGNSTNWQRLRGTCIRSIGGGLYTFDIDSCWTDTVPFEIMDAVSLIGANNFYDENCSFIPKVPNGYDFSCCFGKVFPLGYCGDRIEYELTIDSNNSLLLFSFACIFWDVILYNIFPIGDYFRIKIKDSADRLLNIPCNNIGAIKTNGSYLLCPNFGTYHVHWGQTWTTVGFNLEAFMGQKIKICAETIARTGGSSWSENIYAYAVADCRPSKGRKTTYPISNL